MNLLHVVLSMCESRSSFPTLNWLALPERSGNSFEWRCQRAGKELNINAQKFYCLDIFFFFISHRVLFPEWNVVAHPQTPVFYFTCSDFFQTTKQ